MRTGTGIKQLRQCQRRGHVGRVVDGKVGVGASVHIYVWRETVSLGSMVNTVGGYLSSIPSECRVSTCVTLLKGENEC